MGVSRRGTAVAGGTRAQPPKRTTGAILTGL
jgi:hypothetical protein